MKVPRAYVTLSVRGEPVFGWPLGTMDVSPYSDGRHQAEIHTDNKLRRSSLNPTTQEKGKPTLRRERLR